MKPFKLLKGITTREELIQQAAEAGPGWTMPFLIDESNRGKYFILPEGSHLFCYDIQQRIITRMREIIHIGHTFSDPYSYHCYMLSHFTAQNEPIYKKHGIEDDNPIIVYNIMYDVLDTCEEYTPGQQLTER